MLYYNVKHHKTFEILYSCEEFIDFVFIEKSKRHCLKQKYKKYSMI